MFIHIYNITYIRVCGKIFGWIFKHWRKIFRIHFRIEFVKFDSERGQWTKKG